MPPKAKAPPASIHEPDFVSSQVTEAQRYYLELRPSRALPLALVCGGMERLRPDYMVERRDFPYFCIEFVSEGAGTVILQGKRHRLGPGMAFAYGPGIAHTIRNDPRDPMRKYYVDFSGKEGAKLLDQTPLGTWKPVRMSAPHDLVELFDAMAAEAKGDDGTSREICHTLLRLLLLKMRSHALPGSRAMPRSHSTYQRIRRHVEAHFLRLSTVQELADECHVTPMYAARLFQRFAKTGPYQFLLRLKMNRAAELLHAEGLLVKEVAAALGFADAFHFSRTFKRVHGLSPDQFARMRM